MDTHFDKFVAEPLPSSRIIANCFVTPSMIALTPKGVDETALVWYFTRLEKARTNAVALGSLFKNGVTRLSADREYFHLFNPWGTGYYHWILEVAPKFLLFEQQIREGVVLLPRNCPRFVNEFLELIEFRNTRQVSRCTFVRGLNVISNPKPGKHNPDFILPLRDRVFSELRPGHERTQEQKRLYVSRRQAGRRKVANEDEIRDDLISNGYQITELEDLPFVEQASMFAESDVVMTLHGAALANILFMRPGSSVVELYPRPVDKSSFVNPCYKELCALLGIHHEFRFVKRANSEKEFDVHHDDVIVTPTDLLRGESE